MGVEPGQAGIFAVLGPGALPPSRPLPTNPEGAGCARPDRRGSATSGSDFRVWRSRLRPALGAALRARRPRRTPADSASLSSGSASPETPRARVSRAFGELGCAYVRVFASVCVHVCERLCTSRELCVWSWVCVQS